MLKKIGLGLVLLIIGFVVVVMMQPNEYSVERSAVIDSPRPVIFSYVNDLKKQQVWSPWEKEDPTNTNEWGEKTAGVGGTQRWKGEKTGEGESTIVEVDKNARVKMHLTFVEPFEDEATSEITIVPTTGGNNVTWSMSGNNNFIGKAMGLFMSMEDMLGGQFEEGLAGLKAVAEKEKPPFTTAVTFGERDLSVSGFAPTEADITWIEEFAAAKRKGLMVTTQLEQMSGAPAHWKEAMTDAILATKKLRDGKAHLTGGTWMIEGSVVDDDAALAVEEQFTKDKNYKATATIGVATAKK